MRGRKWKGFRELLFTVIVQTAALTLIPIPERSIIDDRLTSCIISGPHKDSGSGLMHEAEVPVRGQTFLGLYFTKKFQSTIRKNVNIINIFVRVCLCL